MPAPIEFYFDFSSPYSYLLSEQIEAIATRYGRSVEYRPTLLGAVFKVSGMSPLTEIALNGDYSRRAFARSARFAGVKFELPDPFPVPAVYLKAAVDESIARGVCGAPFVFVDGEPFWGNDRLPQIERWLQYGAF